MSMGSQTSSSRGGLAAASSCSGGAIDWLMALSIDGLSECVLTSLTQAGPRRLARDRRHVSPAALALDAGGALDRHTGPRLPLRFHIRRRLAQLYLGDDEQHRQLLGVLLQERQLGRSGGHNDPGLQRASNLFALAQRLDFGEHLLAQTD